MNNNKTVLEPFDYHEENECEPHEIERAIRISQDQLKNAKIFNSKNEYAKTLNKNISYLEVGVGYGDSAQMFIDETNAASADLLDLYENAFGVIHPGGRAPKDSSITHEQHIKNRFSYHPNVNTIKGDMNRVFFTLEKKYDFILFDADTKRFLIRNILKHCPKIVNVDGIVGFTSYMNYDSIHYNMPVGVYQSVNEFLYFNKNWSVDAIVLHDLGFHEIYIKRNS